MTKALDQFMEDDEHTTTDHQGVTGVMSSADHASVDHTGLTGVGISSAAHAAIDHAALPGVLSPAAHAVLDHSAITGVGLNGIRVVDNTITYAALQSLLNSASVSIIYLKPGTYNFGSSVQLDVPADKQLLGMSGGASREAINPMYHAIVFTVLAQNVGSGAYVRLNARARLANVTFNCTGSSGSNSGSCVEVQNGATLENVIIDRWMHGGTTSGAAVYGQHGAIIRNVLVYKAKNWGFQAAFGVDRGPTVFEHCTAYDSDGDGFRLANAVTLIGCHSFSSTGHGFKGHSGCTYQKFIHCNATSNTLSGFDWSNSAAGDGTIVANCVAITNIGVGFNGAVGTVNRPAFASCYGRGNTGGDFNFGGVWQNLSNYTA